MTEKIIELRALPLVHVLQALTNTEHYRRFRELAEPVWIASTPLDLNTSHRRLGEPLSGKPTVFYCPAEQCRKSYKLRTALNNHLYKHREFRLLPEATRDEILHDITFELPAGCGLRSTILTANEPAVRTSIEPVTDTRAHE